MHTSANQIISKSGTLNLTCPRAVGLSFPRCLRFCNIEGFFWSKPAFENLWKSNFNSLRIINSSRQMGFACQASAFCLLPWAMEVYFMNMQKTKRDLGKEKDVMVASKDLLVSLICSVWAIGQCGQVYIIPPLSVWTLWAAMISFFQTDSLTFCQCYELIILLFVVCSRFNLSHFFIKTLIQLNLCVNWLLLLNYETLFYSFLFSYQNQINGQKQSLASVYFQVCNHPIWR